MFAALNLEASQSGDSKSYRLQVIWGIHPQMASWVIFLTRLI